MVYCGCPWRDFGGRKQVRQLWVGVGQDSYEYRARCIMVWNKRGVVLNNIYQILNTLNAGSGEIKVVYRYMGEPAVEFNSYPRLLWLILQFRY